MFKIISKYICMYIKQFSSTRKGLFYELMSDKNWGSITSVLISLNSWIQGIRITSIEEDISASKCAIILI